MGVRHTYRIKHKGVESTPYTIGDLRQMWQAGQIDASTEFRRGDSTVWLEADDLLSELEHVEERPDNVKASDDQPKIYPALRNGVPVAPHSVRVTSLKLPFREVFVLVFKFYLAAILLAALATTAWLLVLRFLR
jgi:hypothetical protein